jgi:phosphoglycolate phosphatase
LENRLKHYQHIIWDWNGTLLDDARACVDVLNEVLTLYGKPTTSYEQYLRDFGFPVSDYYEQLGFDFSRESYDDVARAYIDRYSRRQFDCSLHHRVEDVLRACRSQGLGQSVLSAYQTDLLEQIVKHFGLRDYFLHLAGRDDLYAVSKAEQGKILLSEIRIAPRQTLLIGDTIHDFEVAQELGVDCVLISNGHQRPERLLSCGVPVLKSIREVPLWFSQVSKVDS